MVSIIIQIDIYKICLKNDPAAPIRKGRPTAMRSIKEIMEGLLDSIFVSIDFKCFLISIDFSDGNTKTEEVITILNRGTSLHKVRSLDRFYIRRYFVDLENMRLHYAPSMKQYLCKDVPYSRSYFQILGHFLNQI